MNQLLKLLMAAAFFNALAWITLIPIWQYPDEQAHFAQIQDIAEFGQVPPTGPNTSYEIALSEKILGTERDSLGNNKFTYRPTFKIDYSAGQNGFGEKEIKNLDRSARKDLVKTEATVNPPLYYFLSAHVHKIFSNSDLFTRVYAVRFFSAIIFLANIFVVFKTGQLIFSDSKILALSLTALIAFMPMFVFSSTGILPDPLTNLLFSAVLLISIKILKTGVTKRRLFLSSAVIVLGSITRQHFLIAVPIISVAIFYRFFKSPKYLKRTISVFTLLAILFYLNNKFGTSSPFINNFRIPDLDNLNLGALLSKDFFSYFIWTIKRTYAETLPWYWGVYKWLSLTLPPLSYQIINRFVLVSVMGLVFYFLKIIVKRRKFKGDDFVLIFLILSSLIYFSAIFIWDFLFYKKSGFPFGIQGRYYFPLIIAHIGILLFGFWQIISSLLHKFKNYFLLLLVILVIFFNNFSLWFLSNSYYETSSLGTFINQASQYKPLILKGNILLLIVSVSLASQAIFLTIFARYIIKQNESR